jgi:hypothetical protein
MALITLDQRVNNYFQRIFSNQSSDEVLNIFKTFHASQAPRHKVINSD